MTPDPFALMLSRIQFGLTIGFHYVCLYNARTGKVDDVQMRY